MRQPHRFRSLLMEHLEERALLVAGDPDVTFGVDGRVTANLFEASAENGAVDVVLQTDGKIVVVGNRDYSETGPTLTRYLEGGALDPTFGVQGRVSFASYMSAQAVAIQADGKIVIAGSDYNSGNGSDFALARFNSDGSLDMTFGTEGVATTDFGDNEYGQSIEIDTDGKLVVAGYSSTHNGGNSDFAVARYNSDGSLDVTFGGDGFVTTDFGSSRDYGRSVAIDSSGKIVVAGETTTTNNDFAVARYNSDGSLDTTFDEDGLVITDFASHYDYGYSVTVDSNDRVVVAGYSSGFGFALARYNSNGSLDTTFDGDGMVTTNIGTSSTYGYHVAIDSDERIVVSGNSFSISSIDIGSDFAVARYNSDGSPDTAFG